jgi:hypothetical protein
MLPDVSSANGKTPSERFGSVAQVAAAERIAGAIVASFEMCSRAQVPLSQPQKQALLEAALLEFDGFEAHVTSLVLIGELLGDLGQARGKPPSSSS